MKFHLTTRSGLICLLLASVVAGQALAEAPADSLTVPDPSVAEEPVWAVGVAMRAATIPFNTEERSVSTFIPFVYYDHDTVFYFRGLEGGATFWRPGDWKFSAMARLRFFDIPVEYQNEVQGDTFFGGLQARYSPFGPWHLDLELLNDFKGHGVANARLGGAWPHPKWTLRAYFQAQYRTSKFNSYYYGLNQEDVDAGVELSAGASVLYSVASNFFLFGRAEAALLDKPVRDVSFVNRDGTGQLFLGLGIKNDRTRTTPSVQKSKRYVRLAHGWVTPSSLADIFNFNAADDPGNNQFSSVFYGHPLSDTMFGLPFPIYFHSGLGYHWPMQKQGILEAIVSVKFFFPINWPIGWKLGFAEGWSWVTDIPYVEDQKLREKGYEPSPLLNYLDFSVDFSMGDLFGWIGARETLDKMWIGYDIHHRSAIFESAQQFGRIKGGGNVQMIYLQYDF